MCTSPQPSLGAEATKGTAWKRRGSGTCDKIYEINAAITTEVGACNLVSLAMITKKRMFPRKSSCAKYQDRTSQHELKIQNIISVFGRGP
mmetsp:Transcript_29022/g.70009  ORF Transcript_29022/g.70009 Transcript_29022/m.70009 type:complete len:90 (+) Transcript_29022:1637-1906(+)